MAAGAPLNLTRRAAVVGALGLAAGCGTPAATAPDRSARRLSYGSGADQFGELHLPRGRPKATVVVLHGGYWRDGYGLDLMDPMCRALADDGWAAWNLEYRRLGSGGGWPATFEDVAAGVDHVAQLDGVDRRRVVLLGHSAGGQLAVWAQARTAATPGGAPRVDGRGVVSLAGVLDLTGGYAENLGGGAVGDLMGGSPAEVPQRYRLGDPTRLVPVPGVVALVRGRDDQVVPQRQQNAFLAADRTAGGTTAEYPVDGDHFTVIDPRADSWPVVRRLLATAAGLDG